METLRQDVKFAVRMLFKKPVFAIVAAITLALGIGANTAIFTVINAVLLSSLPYEDPDRLTMIWEKRPHEGVYDNVVSPLDYLDWKARNQSFEATAAQIQSVLDLTGEGEPERLQTGIVSASFFDLLKVKPALGRNFTAEEEQPGKHRVVIISDGLWRRRFGADPNLIGRKLTLSGEPFEAVGVLPPSFKFAGGDLDLWRPIVFSGESMNTRVNHFLNVFARLKPGVTLEQARAEMDQIGEQLKKEYSRENDGHSAHVVSLREELVGEIRPALLILFAAVGLVLLIACANVANLLLARAATRQREVAIRAALGAGRARIVRQLLTESILLSLTGGVLGVLLALWGTDLLKKAIPQNIPQLKEITPDSSVLLFTLGLSILTGLLFGLLPALQASKPNLCESLKEGGRGSEGFSRNRLRSLLVISETALSLILLAGAGLMMRSFLKLQNTEPGFEAKNVVAVGIALPSARYREDQKRRDFSEQLLEGVRALPGADSVALVSHLPLSGEDSRMGIGIEGRERVPNEPPTRAHWRVVTPDYFKTMRMPLIEGRHFTDQDTENSPLAVLVSRTTAMRYWPGQSPVGKRLRLGGTEEWREVAGVVGDVKHWGLGGAVNPAIYLPYRQFPVSSMSVVARTETTPSAFGAAVRECVRAVDKDLPLTKIRSMEEVISNSIDSPRFYMLLLGLFAAVSLLLAAAGIYGVMTYTIAQRTHEIGIRMALGAETRDVMRLVIGQGMTLALIGVAIGLIGSFALTRLMKSLLFEVSAVDPATFAAVSLLLSAIAALACYIPARRATKIDPMIALRYE